MKKRLCLIVALNLLAIFLLLPTVAIAQQSFFFPLTFTEIDPCSGRYTLEPNERTPASGTNTIEVVVYYEHADGTFDRVVQETWDIDWATFRSHSGGLSISTPGPGTDVHLVYFIYDGAQSLGGFGEFLPPETYDCPNVLGCDMRISLKDAVVGRMLESVPAYWGPAVDKMTAPEVLIPWNASLWTFGVDESGEFRKVLLECTFLWVPADAMGPNYDDTWNGTPLPVTVVK